MFDAVPACPARDGERWTAAELARLRREYPRHAACRRAAALAAELGRTPRSLTKKACALGLRRGHRRPRIPAAKVRFLFAAGADCVRAARVLGCRPKTARRWALAVCGRSFPPPPLPPGEVGRRIQRAVRAACARREADSPADWQRLGRMRQYQSKGYPAGVSNRVAAAAWDLACRGGVTSGGLRRHAGCNARRACGVLSDLAGMGVLERRPRAACHWAPPGRRVGCRLVAVFVPARRAGG